ncbi:MAG: phasin family protein [Myxococcaceae bacterium]|nr:phasin family protein [Myxococcaceae bacterium]
MDGAKDRKSPGEVFERLWGQALLAVSAAEEEATRAVQRAAELAGSSQEEVRRQVREFSDRLAGHRKDLERNVEEGVRTALARLRLPRRDELQELHGRLDRLSQRLEALERKA